jgi:hypothetical protein
VIAFKIFFHSIESPLPSFTRCIKTNSKLKNESNDGKVTVGLNKDTYYEFK